MSISATRLAGLNPSDRALFATNARLISCLVTESLLRALYIPISGFETTGICVVLQNNVSSEALQRPYESKDILAIVPLRHVPLFHHDRTDMQEKEISLLDPLDMMPMVFEIDSDGTLPADIEHGDLTLAILNSLSEPKWAISSSTKLVTSKSPVSIWEKFGSSVGLDLALLNDISNEFSSSVKWQTFSYENPPQAPLFISPSVEWEQSIVEGHPTHPMHKTRYFLPPLPDFAPGSFDLYHPRLRLVTFPRESLHITYDFETYTQPIIAAMSKKAGQQLDIPDGRVGVPVHELQIFHIRDKFNEAEICPEVFSLSLLAQQSIRSVIVPEAYQELSLKLGVGIKLTSAVRTISPASAYLGPRFSKRVVPALHMDPKIVTVAKELASVVHSHPDGEIAKHCSAIIREAHENTSEERGERLIVCTALVESGHSGEGGELPAVVRVFGLDTEEKRIQWLSKFVRMLFDAFLPSVMHNGVAFECHPQNCLARFDIVTKELRGFIIRDFGGLRVHPETLKASTGVDLEVHDGHSIIASDLDDVYTRMYHTIFHNHLQQLIRVLGLHYNGRGWEVVRDHLNAVIPNDHPLHAAWLSPERKSLPSKCFLRMRMSGMYRFHLHSPFPNLINYRGVNVDV
ncbi:IucC family-domain-containing protein [Lyophyllum atratum]|nr:IucC family-domain-containing protein [Lyophyllum atratum]